MTTLSAWLLILAACLIFWALVGWLVYTFGWGS